MPYSFDRLVHAYYSCRRLKRNTASALQFEQHLERNLLELHEELIRGSYRPGRSICFVITKPKPREVWAAAFRDRIVHHLLYNKISDRFYRRFIADSCACIPGRGTLYAGQRLESKIRSQTQNWSRPAYYLKCDLANFFVSIDKRVLWPMVARHIPEKWWRMLAKLILIHDPRNDVEIRGQQSLLKLVPPHKRLMEAPEYHGLPIGNLSSQFFANILLDGLDQHVKRFIRAKHYIRYVDDFVLLHESAQWLNEAHDSINQYLPTLGLALNPTKTILQPVDRGVDFAGYVIKPWRRQVRRCSIRTALNRIEHMPSDETLGTINSYLGLVRHTSGYQDRAKIAKAARLRGHSIATNASKAYRKKSSNVEKRTHLSRP
jgi:RNA-directed DNA polymerase